MYKFKYLKLYVNIKHYLTYLSSVMFGTPLSNTLQLGTLNILQSQLRVARLSYSLHSSSFVPYSRHISSNTSCPSLQLQFQPIMMSYCADLVLCVCFGWWFTINVYYRLIDDAIAMILLRTAEELIDRGKRYRQFIHLQISSNYDINFHVLSKLLLGRLHIVSPDQHQLKRTTNLYATLIQHVINMLCVKPDPFKTTEG